jgi:hypothetical protein
VKCIRHHEDATDALQHSFLGDGLTCDDISQLLNHYATLLPYFQLVTTATNSAEKAVRVLTLPSTHRIFDRFRPTFSAATGHAGSALDPEPLDSGSSLQLLHDLSEGRKRKRRERNKENNRVWRARRKRAAAEEDEEQTEEAKE